MRRHGSRPLACLGLMVALGGQAGSEVPGPGHPHAGTGPAPADGGGGNPSGRAVGRRPESLTAADPDAAMLAYRRKLVADTLRLDPQTGKRFWPIYDRYVEELRVVRQMRHAILNGLGANYDNMSEAEAREYVRARIAMEEEFVRVNRRTVQELSRVLSARELARYVQMETKIKAFIEAGIEEEIPLIK